MNQLLPVAFKEWAVAVNALAEGKTILLLRKGGIAEETKDFQLESHSFFLFPTYEHQKANLVKAKYRGFWSEAQAEMNPEAEDIVSIVCRAEVVEDLEIFSLEELEQLRDFHIWTDDFAEERLRWKKKNPLHALLLRVYKLSEPVPIPRLEEYGGCKSWIQLQTDIHGDIGIPVLTDAEFAEQVWKIKHLLSISQQLEETAAEKRETGGSLGPV
ncbi:DUF1802 family protein [Gorillibacterium massiliense]|uniref:DUF1802 family protein n=1 Tax=Gorillibacterium massiliense TaxID=1280390 RepID=UPI0004B2FE4F|nr:DUF1802 family protein [Gorillibacterium massiliense]